VPGDVTDLLRPQPNPRPLFGAGGVLSGTSARAVTEREGALLASVRVTGVTHDSGQVRPGDLYAALPGEHTHGARYAGQAAERGAVALLTDPDGVELAAGSGLPALVHDRPRAILGEVAARVYGHPGADLLVVGVTGTNGKTTITYLLEAALRAAGHRTGVIGTVGTRIGDEAVATVRTTPEATDVHALLAVMRDRGVTAVAMEVSSHALVLGRVDGLVFDLAVFTNLTQDHLDFHGDLMSYFAAKASLFSADRARAALVCVDDEWGRRLRRTTTVPTETYGVESDDADWTVTSARAVAGGSEVHVAGPGGVAHRLEIHLPGRFNVANGLASFAAAVRCGAEPVQAAAGIAGCAGVPGRMERVPDPCGDRGLLALVDYAHTPDAVGRAVAAAREGARGRVVVVVGAGGDRDPQKRGDMGRVAAELADHVIVTDDNPRSEDPAVIRAALLAGASAAGHASVVEVADRREAIGSAVAGAGAGGVVLVLGKGHEQGQEVAGRVHPFDDRVALATALAQGRT
jgi:UDP-N-acetylmuramoyl-L-alanyl-D-glutamate--2,6-diaminopimelate ligase